METGDPAPVTSQLDAPSAPIVSGGTTSTDAAGRIDRWRRRAIAAGIGAALAFVWSQSIVTLVAAPDMADLAGAGIVTFPLDIIEPSWPGPSRWIAAAVAALSAGILGGIDLRTRRRAAVAGTAAVVAAASAFAVLHTWAIADEYGPQFQQLRNDAASFRWFTAAIASGTIGAVVVAWVVARWRPPGLGALVALVGIAWVVVGSGYRRPLSQTARPFERADGADIIGSLDRAPMLLAAGLAIAVVGVAITAWAPRRSTTPPAIALSSIVAAGAAYLTWSSLTHTAVLVGSFMEGRPARRRGHVIIPAHEVLARADGSMIGGAGDAWLRAAAAESSSITAFADLSTHLARVGAPRRLVERCDRAAADEVRHVSCCVTLAAAEGVIGRAGAVAPTVDRAPQRHRATPRTRDLRRLVRESIVDGMLGEGFAAARLELGAAQAGDLEVRSVLEGIARDERSHAALAVDIVRWCASIDPATTRHEVDATLARLDRSAIDASELDALPAEVRRLAGFADAEQAASCWRATVDAVVADLRCRLR